jgi:hypothetical protein
MAAFGWFLINSLEFSLKVAIHGAFKALFRDTQRKT